MLYELFVYLSGKLFCLGYELLIYEKWAECLEMDVTTAKNVTENDLKGKYILVGQEWDGVTSELASIPVFKENTKRTKIEVEQVGLKKKRKWMK